MCEAEDPPILTHFATLKDPRQHAKVLYPLVELLLDGTASPRARVSRLSGLASVSFRMAGKVARRNFNERRPPCRHYVRG